VARNPITGTNYFQSDMPDGESHQDRRVSNMTLDELRAWRNETANLASKGGRHATDHNKYRNQTIRDIEQGARLNNADLQRLIKSARSKAGIDVSELLSFTLGDTVRNNELLKTLDASVLNAYLANVKKAASQFTGGITPQQVINLSRAVDIKRANEQIFLASLFKREGNVFYFLTNAGPDSKSQNHKVTVQLLDYPQLLVNTTKAPSANNVRKTLKDGKIKFDCDCGRHQFWYRYIATVGKYNFGIDETRYPSTRNPNLTGLGCKHVLRVMNHVTSGMMVERVRNEAKKDIAKAQNQTKSHVNRREQVEREAQRQAEQMNNWNGRLHWARKVKKAVDKAAKAIERENKQEKARAPNRPTRDELSSYNYAKKQVKKASVPDNFKQIYKAAIEAHESKWGAS